MLEARARTTSCIEGIARDSREQAAAIEEVNVAVRTLDEMTQHNAALVEETNAAIEQTEAQATELDRIVEVFSVADTALDWSSRAARRARQSLREPVSQPADALRAREAGPVRD